MKTLFEDYDFNKLEIKKKGSERAEVLKYFVENLKNKKGERFCVKMIAFKLSHLSVPDLYYLKSVCQDISTRKGDEAMNKYFWWSIKAK